MDMRNILAPPSLSVWYPAFAAPQDVPVTIGELGTDLDLLLDAVLERPAERFRILSGHDSFERDLALADLMRRRGLSVDVQTPSAVAHALDKRRLKEHLTRRGLPTPDWGLGGAARNSLLKRRNSTQSRGLRWAGRAGPDESEYWEAFVDGEEYSVNAYRTRGSVHTLPIVRKGATDRDLTPPWRRPRVVGRSAPAQAQLLLDLAVRICDDLDIWGFAEIEFVVAAGTPYILDVNPRVSGTLRLSAMAAQVAVFDEAAVTGRAHHEAVVPAAEVPYAGPPLRSPQVIATSRLTVAAADPREVEGLLRRHGVGSADLNRLSAWL